MKFTYLLSFFLITITSLGQTLVLDQDTKEPVSFATISFGDGHGIFADDEGRFVFTKKLYKDIDTLYISALGYHNLKISSKELSSQVFLKASVEELTEVSITSKPKGKFKIKTIKPVSHDDYYKCWLPTIESEIAVFFPNEDDKTKRISKLLLPIKIEDNWSSKSSKKLKFSTLFRVQFYTNDNQSPGQVISEEKIVFIVTHDTKKLYELDLSEYNIPVPKNGVFASIQVLGYTDKNGKLLPNKKYQEIKTKRGLVKISTTFRPLLPFTDAIETKRTYIKRIFLNSNKWQLFDNQYVQDSNLLKSGLNNYGMGMKMKVYKK